MKTRKPTPEQKAAAVARRERLATIAATIAALPVAERQRLIDEHGGIATCQGHALSDKNACSLIMQRPTVSLVGGFRQWEDLGRKVRKGSKALAIFAPTAPASKGDSEDETPARPRFRVVNVFDVADTEPLETATA